VPSEGRISSSRRQMNPAEGSLVVARPDRPLLDTSSRLRASRAALLGAPWRLSDPGFRGSCRLPRCWGAGLLGVRGLVWVQASPRLAGRVPRSGDVF
jgi:hypothetical protein